MSSISILDGDALPRKVVTAIFLVDTSGSMKGTKIGQVNDAITRVLPMIKKMSGENNEAEVRIAALSFGTQVQWMTPEPRSSDSFYWNDMQAEGMTSMGEAFKMLESKLHRRDNGGFMTCSNGYKKPVLILLSDGEPTDDYRSGLEILKHNNWFLKSIKAAIAIGEDANKSILREFTGDANKVVTVLDVDQLYSTIQNVSMSAIESSINDGDMPNPQPTPNPGPIPEPSVGPTTTSGYEPDWSEFA